jgi:hemerythrin-like domain-containing protein
MAARKDAIALLKQDHAKVKQLLKQLTETTNRATKRRVDLLREIEVEIRVHARIEEEIFYPAFRQAIAKDELHLYFEAVEEHHLVDLVLPELSETDADSEEFAGKAKVLRDLIEHHAEEEETEMFKLARKSMEQQELDLLGERLARRKAELLDRPRAKGTLRPQPARRKPAANGRRNLQGSRA